MHIFTPRKISNLYKISSDVTSLFVHMIILMSSNFLNLDVALQL